MAQYKIKGLANANSGYSIKGLATKKPEEEGISSIPSDIGNAGLNLLMAAGNKVMQLPTELTEAGEQLAENPNTGLARAGGNYGAGLLEGAKGLYNLPLNINTYLGSKGIPLFKQTAPYAEKLKIGDTGLQKAIFGEPQKGDELWNDLGELTTMIAGPESVGVRPALTSKGILKSLSKEKAKQQAIAKKDYSELFTKASTNGINFAPPLKTVTANSKEIIKNSVPKYHESFKEYLAQPSIENAHWAQSELGALERHLDKIAQKTGLTPSQIKTYKAVIDARKGIKQSMFSHNAFGKDPMLGVEYEKLGNKYREEVIPYTSLEELTEVEGKKLRPRKAVKELLNNEEFMINLAKKFPGIYLHSPLAKKAKWGALGLFGYDEMKRLLREN